MNDKIERRNFGTSELVNIQNKRIDTDYYVEGYATVFEKKYLLGTYAGKEFFETVSRNALNGTDLSDIKLMYNHGGKVLARNTNGTLGYEINSKGFLIFADLSKTAASRDFWEEISVGLINQMSFAFDIEEESFNEKTNTRTVMKIGKIYEVSATPFPANEQTEIYARSKINESIAKRASILSMSIKLLTGGTK
ncbi:MAG: HK97 family phage prohead protease [Clostridiales bacterium]|jgi:HK97 family phage prohead protease|nr:HK97 family phage prohead protease [Clostridiales bacterium]